MQLRFTSLTVTSSREDLHLQECAHAGRTQKNPPDMVPGGLLLVAAHRAPLPVDQSLRVDMNESKRDSAKRNHNT